MMFLKEKIRVWNFWMIRKISTYNGSPHSTKLISKDNRRVSISLSQINLTVFSWSFRLIYQVFSQPMIWSTDPIYSPDHLILRICLNYLGIFKNIYMLPRISWPLVQYFSHLKNWIPFTIFTVEWIWWSLTWRSSSEIRQPVSTFDILYHQ
jgi:hypothetical protein